MQKHIKDLYWFNTYNIPLTTTTYISLLLNETPLIVNVHTLIDKLNI